MKGTKSYLGIDVSKEWFDVSLVRVSKGVKSPMQTERFENEATGLKKFLRWLKAGGVSNDGNTLVVMENTGVYHRLLWQFFSGEGFPLHIGNATEIRLSMGITRGKDDVKDSRRLCDYCIKNAEELQRTPPLDPGLLKLKDLYTARIRLVRQIGSINHYLRELKGSNSREMQKLMEQGHKAALAGLKKSLADIEAAMSSFITENQAVAANYKLLNTVPGIGRMTAIYLICCTNNFSIKRSGKQLASYAGVVPFEYSSGKSVKGKSRVHKMANKDLKKLLHLSALSAKNHYPEFRNYFARKKAEGKAVMSILNAIRNKIILRAVAVINTKRPYVDNYSKIS